MIELTEQFVTNRAQTRLIQLSKEIADSRSLTKPEIVSKITLATKIRLWLKALSYGAYLTQSTREKIRYCLADLANVYDIPYAPTLNNTEPPSILVGIQGQRGERGLRGEDGGGTDFRIVTSIDTVVDSFSVTEARGARWDYVVYGDDGQRVGSIRGGWNSDGSSYGDDGDQSTDDIYGSTDDVTFQVYVSGTTVQLLAFIADSDKTWTIEGSRYFMPNQGTGIAAPTTLANGKLWMGNASNVPTEVTISGSITLSNTGVTALTNGSVSNVHIAAGAGISLNKLAALTADKVVITNGTGFLTTSALDASKLLHLTNVTSDIQAQIDAIASAGAITGAITPYVTNDAVASRVIISNPVGKFAVSTVTSAEVSRLSGVVGGVTSSASSSPRLIQKVIEIGDWNIHASGGGSALKDVPHGLSNFKKIRGVEVIVRNDLDTSYFFLPVSGFAINYLDSTNIRLSSSLDFPGFSATSYNRGWVTITYEA